MYFNDNSWFECHSKVSLKFTELKRIMRKFYTDKCDEDILKELLRYSPSDIGDVLSQN